MRLIEKIKNKINRNNETPKEQKEIPIKEFDIKYENMTIIAPSKRIYHGDKVNFYINALDKNNNPICGEKINVKISGKHYEFTTNDRGFVTWPIDLPPKRHKILIQFPNGEYSQVIESELNVKVSSKRPKAKKVKKINPKHTSLLCHNMKMYINSEGQFYAKLRDFNFDPISGEEVEFKLDNEIYKSITDEEGLARINIKNLKSGTYDIDITYKGSQDYDSCKNKAELKMVVRNIDKEVIIDVQNLTMEFKVTKDKIDTLKEFIIRTIKRNKEKHEKIKILDDISFKVYKGDKLGILGFNGAGKSTLLKIMSGIYEPTSGKIITKGKIAPLLELGAGFDKNYTGRDNIYLNASLLSIDEKTINEKYDEIVEFSELGDFINYPIKNYSSGMRTKLGFSIATQINPDILIIDEILSVGDIKFKKKSAKKINSMMKDGVTVLLVTHSINQMKKICDTCIWLEDGHIKMYGEADEVCDAYVSGAQKDMKKRK